MSEVLSGFLDDELVHVVIGNGRVQPVGRGAATVPSSEVYFGNGVEGCCEQQLNLTIAPNGNVYPCCRGADMTESLACGNIYRDTLAEAVLMMRTDQMIRQIIHEGTGQLVPIIQRLGFGDRLLPYYSSICHLCWDVFKDNELAAALREYFQDQQFEMLVEFVTEAMNREQSSCYSAEDLVAVDSAG
jgi:hypothetical protein